MLENIWGNFNGEAFLRKQFTLESAPKEAFLRIYADTGYELWLNGRFVATVDEWANTRDYNVRLFLNKGTNTVAVHAINHNGHRGCAVEIVADGQTVTVTDGTWKAADEEHWGWILPDFDDAAWATATVRDMSAAGGPQWWTKPGTEPERIVPTLDCSQFFNGAIPKTCASPYWNAKPIDFEPNPAVVKLAGEDYAKQAHTPHLMPIEQAKAILNNTGIAEGTGILIPQTERYIGPSFVVDFGKEVLGFFRLRLQSDKPLSFRLYYGESLGEAMSETSREEAQNKMLKEEYRVRQGVQEFESRMRVAFRFVRVEFFDATAPVLTDGFSIRTVLYPVARKGYFHCDDEKMNRLWAMGERTQHFCMLEYYLDAPKRDRFLWTGDARMQALINYYTFGDTQLFEFCWHELARTQFPNGGISSAYGEGCSMLWDYVAWYIIAFYDYYMYTGKLDFVMKHLDSLNRAVDFLTSLTDETGLIRVPENPLGKLWMVVLWNYVGYDPYLNELYVRSLNTALYFAKLAGDPVGVQKYRGLLEKLEPVLKEKDCFSEMLAEDKRAGGHSTQQYEHAEIELNRGDISAMVARIRKYWFGMLASGADCLYEGTGIGDRERIDEFHAQGGGNGSICHAWTGGPTVLLSKGIAGIRPLTPGFETVEIKPVLGDLKSVRCVVPTPKGELAVCIENGTIAYHLPEGCKGELVLGDKRISVCGDGSEKM